MRKQMITLLCVAALMLWGVTSAQATNLNWTLLMHSSVAGVGPGPDAAIGTADDTTSNENNNCNFSIAKNCKTSTTTPALGSYSFSAIEYTNPTWYSCLDLASGPTSGAPCTCAEGGSCTSDGDCASSGCGAGDCCAGGSSSCKACTDNPTSWDSFSYFGINAQLGPAPNMTTCQAVTTNDFEITAYHVATSESIPGSGGACIKMKEGGGPYTADGCGPGPITNGSLDVDVYVYGCSIVGTTINNIQYSGRIVDMDNVAAASECGYNLAQTQQMVTNARERDANAEYLMVMCGATTVPMDSKTACLRGADVDFVVVAYTSGDASDCPASACP